MKTRYIAFVSAIFLCTVFTACTGGKKEKNGPEENIVIPEMKPAIPEGMKKETVQFPSADGLMITADVYVFDSIAPVIVLCHQAGFSKYEFAEIAPHLTSLGFNCIAIDQRSGGDMNDANKNETYARAKEKDLPTDYLSAEQDIKAGVEYAVNRWKKPVILWGSSYAGALAMKIGAQNNNVKAVVAFSPGEYFPDKSYIKNSIKGFDKPIFVTSTEKESGALEKLTYDIPRDKLTFYYPEGKGTHGSKALWSTDPAREGYQKAVDDFLIKLKLQL